MRWGLAVSVFAVLLSCRNEAGKSVLPIKELNKDTLSAESLPYLDVTDSTLDSSGYIKMLADFAVQKLALHSNKPYFDTAVLLRGYNGRVRFYQGKLFSGERNKAVVQVHGNGGEDPFLIFTNQGGWRLRQVLYGYGRISDSAVRLYDYNFDGIKDLAIVWNYSAGRCSCSSPGCVTLYLYDDGRDSLIKVPEIDSFLDFAVAREEKAIYLGEHCDGFYGRFQWKNGQLQKTEAFLFTERESVSGKASWILEHSLYKNDVKTSTARKKNAEMPLYWKQMFGWDEDN